MSAHGFGVSAIAAAAVVAAALTGAAADGSLGSGHGRTTRGFTLRGHVGGLYPGARRRLVVVVHNSGSRSLRVRSITTRVRDAKPGCSAKNLRVSAFRGRARVPAGRSRRLAVSIRMLSATPTTCQGAVFVLLFRGRATR